MAWQLFENIKEGKLGEVETKIALDGASVQNLALSIFTVGFLLILLWFLLKKKL